MGDLQRPEHFAPRGVVVRPEEDARVDLSRAGRRAGHRVLCGVGAGGGGGLGGLRRCSGGPHFVHVGEVAGGHLVVHVDQQAGNLVGAVVLSLHAKVELQRLVQQVLQVAHLVVCGRDRS